MMLGLLTLTCGTAWAQVYRNARSAVLRNEDRPNRHSTSYAPKNDRVASVSERMLTGSGGRLPH